TNIQNIKYLIDIHKIKPDVICLKNLAKHLGNTSLTYLLDFFNSTTDNSNINQDTIEISKKIQNIERENEINSILEFQDELEEILIEENKDNKNSSLLCNLSDNSKQSKTIYDKKQLNIVVEDIDIQNDKEYKIAKITNNSKINKREKYALKIDAIKLLSLKKNTKLTFLEA